MHIGVSIFYALISALILNINHSPLVNCLQIIVLGWLTTILATLANEFVVKAVTTLQFPALNSLSALNTETGPKLWLHFMFFMMVVAGLWFVKLKNNSVNTNV